MERMNKLRRKVIFFRERDKGFVIVIFIFKIGTYPEISSQFMKDSNFIANSYISPLCVMKVFIQSQHFQFMRKPGYLVCTYSLSLKLLWGLKQCCPLNLSSSSENLGGNTIASKVASIDSVWFSTLCFKQMENIFIMEKKSVTM